MEFSLNEKTGEFVIKGKVADAPQPSKSGKSTILATTNGFVLVTGGKLSLNYIR